MKKQLFKGKCILLFEVNIILLVVLFVFSACSNDSKKAENYNPDKVDQKTIDSLELILAKTANDPLTKSDSGDIIDLGKNEVIGFQITTFYLKKESERLDYAIRDEVFNSGITLREVFYFWDNKPLLAYRTKMSHITGAIPGEESFLFYKDNLYVKKGDSIILSTDNIQHLALAVLKDYGPTKIVSQAIIMLL